MRRYKKFIFTILLFLTIPWVNIKGKHLFLIDFFNSRFECCFTAIEANTYQLITALVVITVVLFLMLALMIHKQWCGKFCPSTFLSLIKTLYSKHYFLTVIFILPFGAMFSLAFLGYFMPINTALGQVINVQGVGVWVFYAALFLFYVQTFLLQGWYCAYLCPYGALCTILPAHNKGSKLALAVGLAMLIIGICLLCFVLQGDMLNYCEISNEYLH